MSPNARQIEPGDTVFNHVTGEVGTVIYRDTDTDDELWYGVSVADYRRVPRGRIRMHIRYRYAHSGDLELCQ